MWCGSEKSKTFRADAQQDLGVFSVDLMSAIISGISVDLMSAARNPIIAEPQNGYPLPASSSRLALYANKENTHMCVKGVCVELHTPLLIIIAVLLIPL